MIPQWVLDDWTRGSQQFIIVTFLTDKGLRLAEILQRLQREYAWRKQITDTEILCKDEQKLKTHITFATLEEVYLRKKLWRHLGHSRRCRLLLPAVGWNNIIGNSMNFRWDKWFCFVIMLISIQPTWSMKSGRRQIRELWNKLLIVLSFSSVIIIFLAFERSIWTLKIRRWYRPLN